MQHQFKTYSKLIFVLLTVEQTNQLLLKNHDLRSLVLRQFLKQMPMKIKKLVDLETVDEDQDVVIKGVMVDPHITITNPNKEMLMPQIRTKAKSLWRNMTMIMPTTVVA